MPARILHHLFLRSILPSFLSFFPTCRTRSMHATPPTRPRLAKTSVGSRSEGEMGHQPQPQPQPIPVAARQFHGALEGKLGGGPLRSLPRHTSLHLASAMQDPPRCLFYFILFYVIGMSLRGGVTSLSGTDQLIICSPALLLFASLPLCHLVRACRPGKSRLLKSY